MSHGLLVQVAYLLGYNEMKKLIQCVIPENTPALSPRLEIPV